MSDIDLSKKEPMFTDITVVPDEDGPDEEEEYEESEDFALPPPQTLSAIRDQYNRMRFTDYLEKFDEFAQQQTVVFSSVPAEVVDERQRAQLLALGIEAEDEYMQHQNDLDHIELLKKRRMFELNRRAGEQRAQQNRNIKEIAVKASLTEELLGTYFEHTKQQLKLHLTSRKAEVTQSIGEVRKFLRSDYNVDKPDWSTFEQQVELNVQVLRGVKNKLPKGEYMILVSKWDKLAGDPMRWSNRKYNDRHPPPCPLHQEVKNLSIRSQCEICQGWAGGTMPVHHDGDPLDYEMRFDSRTFTFFPSQRRIRPYMALMLELVRLPPNRKGQPKIVGWGVMPCIDSNFEIINGKFRFPMLRGSYKPSYMHHRTVAEAISRDIENWLCNCYIDIFPHHREHMGRDEFRLQNEFTAKLLNLDEDEYPVKIDDRDGWVVEQGRPRGYSFRVQQQKELMAGNNADEADNNAMSNVLFDANEMSMGLGFSGGKSLEEKATKENILANSAEMENLVKKPGEVQLGTTGGGGFGDELDEEEELDRIDPNFPYQRPDVWPLEETPALSYWAMIRTAVRNKAKEKRQEELQKQRRLVLEAEKKKKYRFSIHPHGAVLLHSAWEVQVNYCTRAILDDISFSRGPKHYKFWLNILAFCIAVAVQVYLYSCMKYVACLLFGIPADADPEPYGLVVNYSLVTTYPLQEYFICFFSQLGNYAAVAVLVLFAFILQKVSGVVPENLSKFVYALAFGDILVPFVMLFIDLGLGTHLGDIRRLPDYFAIHNYGAYYGYLIFILTYFIFCSVLYVTVFLYTMRLHLNGIIQDSYWRILLVNEDNFFIPEDLELSRRELFYILERAERWRGKTGNRRKVMVHQITTTDEEDPKYKALAQYIVIKELKCGNAEEFLDRMMLNPEDPEYALPYRQFYVMGDGAILEVLKNDLPSGMAYVLARLNRKFMTGTGNFNPVAQYSLGGPSVYNSYLKSSKKKRKSTASTAGASSSKRASRVPSVALGHRRSTLGVFADS